MTKKEKKTNSQSQLPDIVHVKAIGGEQKHIDHLSKILKTVGQKHNIEFIITNENIELQSAKQLMTELYKLVKYIEEKENKEK